MSELYMVIEYVNACPQGHGSPAPDAIHVRMHGPHGPEFATVSWDASKPVRTDSGSFRLTAAVRVNGAPGLAAFAMHGARLLRVDAADGPVEVLSVRFGQKPGTPGITLSDTPMLSSGTDANADISHYLNRNGLFVDPHAGPAGSAAAIWFHEDVSVDAVNAFLKRHRTPSSGLFASAARIQDEKIEWRLCVIYPHPDLMARDLAQWQSDDAEWQDGEW